MELIYENKKSKDNILEMAYSPNNKKIENFGKNLLIEGDNFKALSCLLPNYKGKIDLIYIDPPFNTNLVFGVSEGRANSISKSRNMSVAYSDKMGKDEFLEFLRERLIIMRELLSEEGSIYLHIDYKIGHYVKIIMDEVFGESNFNNDIARIKSNPKNFARKAYGNEKDLVLFYSKSKGKNIWNNITIPLSKEEIDKAFLKVDKNGRRYTTIPLHAPGESSPNSPTGQPWRGIPVPKGRHWRTDPSEFDILDTKGDIEWSSKGNPRIKKYADEHKGKKIQDIWTYKDPQYPTYPTEKNHDMLKMIIQQSSNEKSIVLDCFCGSGSALIEADKLNRKWIGIDASELSIKIFKKNLCDNNIKDYDFINI